MKKVEDEAKVCDEEDGSGDEDVVNRRRNSADMEIANIYGIEDGWMRHGFSIRVLESSVWCPPESHAQQGGS